MKRTASPSAAGLAVSGAAAIMPLTASAVQSVTGQPCHPPAKHQPPLGSIRKASRNPSKLASICWRLRKSAPRRNAGATPSTSGTVASACRANPVSQEALLAPATRVPASSSSQIQPSSCARALRQSASSGSRSHRPRMLRRPLTGEMLVWSVVCSSHRMRSMSSAAQRARRRLLPNRSYNRASSYPARSHTPGRAKRSASRSWLRDAGKSMLANPSGYSSSRSDAITGVTGAWNRTG